MNREVEHLTQEFIERYLPPATVRLHPKVRADISRGLKSLLSSIASTENAACADVVMGCPSIHDADAIHLRDRILARFDAHKAVRVPLREEPDATIAGFPVFVASVHLQAELPPFRAFYFDPTRGRLAAIGVEHLTKAGCLDSAREEFDRREIGMLPVVEEEDDTGGVGGVSPAVHSDGALSAAAANGNTLDTPDGGVEEGQGDSGDPEGRGAGTAGAAGRRNGRALDNIPIRRRPAGTKSRVKAGSPQ